jgi:hypothetical protein
MDCHGIDTLIDEIVNMKRAYALMTIGSNIGTSQFINKFSEKLLDEGEVRNVYTFLNKEQSKNILIHGKNRNVFCKNKSKSILEKHFCKFRDEKSGETQKILIITDNFEKNDVSIGEIIMSCSSLGIYFIFINNNFEGLKPEWGINLDYIIISNSFNHDHEKIKKLYDQYCEFYPNIEQLKENMCSLEDEEIYLIVNCLGYENCSKIKKYKSELNNSEKNTGQVDLFWSRLNYLYVFMNKMCNCNELEL